ILQGQHRKTSRLWLNDPLFSR
ncbi:unnamed protein product, partial [Allacma fusca]